MDAVVHDGISKEVAEKILSLQRRCFVCGAAWPLHIHHRIFRSEGEVGLRKHLAVALKLYEKCYGVAIEPWGLHDIQNLIVLCKEHHEGETGVHGGNEPLREFIKNSFTCPLTGFNRYYFSLEFYKRKQLLSSLNNNV